jgi:hypothetical protein
MDTPGTEDGSVDGSGGLGRLRYRLRLSIGRVKAQQRKPTVVTHAVEQPSNPTDQMMAYQIIPTMESPTCKT